MSWTDIFATWMLHFSIGALSFLVLCLWFSLPDAWPVLDALWYGFRLMEFSNFEFQCVVSNFRIFECFFVFSNFRIFEFSRGFSNFLNFRIFEFLNFRIFEFSCFFFNFLNFWIFEFSGKPLPYSRNRHVTKKNATVSINVTYQALRLFLETWPLSVTHDEAPYSTTLPTKPLLNIILNCTNHLNNRGLDHLKCSNTNHEVITCLVGDPYASCSFNIHGYWEGYHLVT